MRKILSFAATLAVIALPLCAGAQTTAKKKTSSAHKATASTTKTGSSSHKTTASTHKTTAHTKTTTHRSTAGTSHSTGSRSRTASTRRSSRKPVARTTWRNRQMTPTPERYKEIQDALVAKGYLTADDANGTWGQSSSDALKKFQADQNISADGKLNSLSLIALGLGPKHDTASATKPVQDSHPQESR